MDILPWYNENQFRHYPLQPNDILARDYIVDAGFSWLKTELDPSSIDDELRLFKIVKTNAVLECHLFASQSYLVNIPLNATDYTTYPCFKSTAVNCSSPATLAGTITVANIPKLAAELQNGDNILNVLFDTGCYDFVCMQTTTRLRIGNVHKRQSNNFGDCGIPKPTLFTKDAFVLQADGVARAPVVYQTACPGDALRVVGGVNAEITANTASKQIRFAINTSSPLPNCQEIPLSQTEADLIATRAPTISPQKCSQVVTSLNGLAGPHVSVLGGPGVTIRKKNENTLQIVLNDRTTGVCPGS